MSLIEESWMLKSLSIVTQKRVGDSGHQVIAERVLDEDAGRLMANAPDLLALAKEAVQAMEADQERSNTLEDIVDRLKGVIHKIEVE